MSMIFYEDSSPLEIVTVEMIRQAMTAAPARRGYAELLPGHALESADCEAELAEA